MNVSAVALVTLLCACGESSPPSQQPRRLRAPTRSAASLAAVRPLVSLDPHRLPAAVSGEAALASAGGILVIGGLDSSDVSTSAVMRLNPTTGRALQVGVLAQAAHDTAAAEIRGRTFVFGGGSATELDLVQALSPSSSGRIVGRLPSARSDLSALTIGDSAYLLGGYDGVAPLAEVLRTSDARRFVGVTRLAVAPRYAAVAAIGSRIYLFGGELEGGEDSNAIQMLDTRTGKASVIGRLPRAISHASAVELGGQVYVLGGRSSATALRQIVAFNPTTHRVRLAGRLPIAVTNAAAAQQAGSGYLIGGIDSSGRTLNTVIQIRLPITSPAARH